MIPRHITKILETSLRNFPVVLLVGARQVGKSTLVKAIASSSWPARYVTFDDRTVLDAALTDPDGFIGGLHGPVIIDEVQRAPDVLRAIKLVVDHNRRPGMFLLTGSANVLTLAAVSESLAGRVAVHELHPFSLAELNKKCVPSVMDTLFSAGSSSEIITSLELVPPAIREDPVKKFIISGGYPVPALMKDHAARRTWFESYRKTYIERDLRDIANIANLPDFNRLLTILALRTGQVLNVSGLARTVGLPTTSVRRYFNLLVQTYQAFLVRPYLANPGKRLVRSSKVYAGDTGQACCYGATDTWQTLEQQGRAGFMVETWVANELRKLLPLMKGHTDLYFWRERTGYEVDFILERGGEVIGLEVKLGTGIPSRTLKSFKRLRESFGDRCRFCVLLHGGKEAVAVGERTLALSFRTFFW